MLLACRNGFAAKVPKPLPYDAEVEYLESTGTQWIDTGVKWDCAGDIKCLFAPMKDNNAAQASFGADNGFGVYNNNQAMLVVNGGWSGYVNWANAVSAGDKFYFDLANHTITKFTGEYKTFTGSAYAVSASNMTLFKYEIYYGHCRIYSFSCTSQGGVKMDLIPVRKDGVGYMYDKVSGKLLGNAGTGAFTIGPDCDVVNI